MMESLDKCVIAKFCYSSDIKKRVWAFQQISKCPSPAVLHSYDVWRFILAVVELFSPSMKMPTQLQQHTDRSFFVSMESLPVI